MKERGKLFVLEGGVCCGKSTQMGLLARELGEGWSFYREPGSTSFGELVRNAVQSRMGERDREPYPVHPYAALFGYSAARANLIRTKVLPDLAAGINVGLDRYWFSTYAYQGAEGVSKPIIFAISWVATAGLKPNLVLHYDLLPELAIERRNNKYESDIDRYDAKELAFHRVVRTNYHQLKHLFPGIWKVVDASKPIGEVKTDSLRLLKEKGLIR